MFFIGLEFLDINLVQPFICLYEFVTQVVVITLFLYVY